MRTYFTSVSHQITTTLMLIATAPPYIWTLAFYICALKRPPSFDQPKPSTPKKNDNYGPP